MVEKIRIGIARKNMGSVKEQNKINILIYYLGHFQKSKSYFPPHILKALFMKISKIVSKMLKRNSGEIMGGSWWEIMREVKKG